MYIMIFMTENNRQCFLLLIYYFKPSCHNDSGTLIFAPESLLFFTILNREAHPILTNMRVCMAFAVFYMYNYSVIVPELLETIFTGLF